MEREGVEDTARVLRAIRSLVYNRRVLPIIERRIFQAETTIRAHLLVRNSTDDQVGPYQVELDEAENIQITQTSFDVWNQMLLPISDEKLVLAEEEILSRVSEPTTGTPHRSETVSGLLPCR